MLLSIALALMVAQGLSGFLIWRAQRDRHEAALVNAAAFRLLGAPPRERAAGAMRERPDRPPLPDDGFRLPRPLRLQVAPDRPDLAGDRHLADAEKALREVLETQGVAAAEVVVIDRNPRVDPVVSRWWEQQKRRFAGLDEGPPPRLVVASLRRPDGSWLSARMVAPPAERRLLMSILMQTVILYLVLVGAVALILRRIARPLKALTRRVEAFTRDQTVAGQLRAEGPDDIQRLINAHNAMEGRIAGLLDEKDVMLGAIGHDLKTPLAALRVRIEAVDDDAERGRMAATIEDINRSLDDILSLARVGRPSDPLETTELSALVADVVGEFEDIGGDVVLGHTDRIVLPLRSTWLRRAMRNLVSNALRYGHQARVSLERQGQAAVLRIEDDGPGIPESEIERMMQPFTRLDPSRNTGTGGTGLGLTLARAIADQHGGSLSLQNRREGDRVTGLNATLRLPLA